MVTQNENKEIPPVLGVFLGDENQGTLAQILQVLDSLGLKYRINVLSSTKIALELKEGDLVPLDQFEEKFLALLRNLGFVNTNGSSNPIANYRNYYVSLDYDEWENEDADIDILISEKVIKNSEGEFVHPWMITIEYEGEDNE